MVNVDIKLSHIRS